MSNCVLQDWMLSLSMKKQTVLIEITRAPDVLQSNNIKKLKRFLRSVILKNADRSSTFMDVSFIMPHFHDMKDEMEALPVHSFHHLLMAIQILGCDHPSENIRRPCIQFYLSGVKSLHHNPETKEQMDRRLQDVL